MAERELLSLREYCVGYKDTAGGEAGEDTTDQCWYADGRIISHIQGRVGARGLINSHDRSSNMGQR